MYDINTGFKFLSFSEEELKHIFCLTLSEILETVRINNSSPFCLVMWARGKASEEHASISENHPESSQGTEEEQLCKKPPFWINNYIWWWIFTFFEETILLFACLTCVVCMLTILKLKLESFIIFAVYNHLKFWNVDLLYKYAWPRFWWIILLLSYIANWMSSRCQENILCYSDVSKCIRTWGKLWKILFGNLNYWKRTWESSVLCSTIKFWPQPQTFFTRVKFKHPCYVTVVLSSFRLVRFCRK